MTKYSGSFNGRQERRGTKGKCDRSRGGGKDEKGERRRGEKEGSGSDSKGRATKGGRGEGGSDKV